MQSTVSCEFNANDGISGFTRDISDSGGIFVNRVCLTPGPSQLHADVAGELHRAVADGDLSRSHRSDWFSDLYFEVKTQLFDLLGVPSDYRLFFVSSGTEAMERTIQNLVFSDSCHFVNGAFSDRFWKTSVGLGKSTSCFEAPYGESFLVDDYELPANSELVCITQNETSAGTQVPPDSIHRLVRKYPDKLIALDVVSTCPYASLDYSLIDVAFFSVQKCFGLPAGLGVMMVSPRAVSVAADLVNRGGVNTGYHSFEQLAKWEASGQTPETPNVLAILLLRRVLADYCLRGIDTIRLETDQKYALLNDFVVRSQRYYPVVESDLFRSRTAYAIGYNGDAFALRRGLSDLGFDIGSGYLERKAQQSRIANFPTHTYQDYERLVEALGQF